MSIRDTATTLSQHTRSLKVEWERTQVEWNDRKSREFDQNYLAALPDTIAATGLAIKELDIVLRKIRKDCE